MRQIIDFKEIEDIRQLRILFNMFVNNEKIVLYMNDEGAIDKILLYDNDITIH